MNRETLREALKKHQWSDHPETTCSCGWKAPWNSQGRFSAHIDHVVEEILAIDPERRLRSMCHNCRGTGAVRLLNATVPYMSRCPICLGTGAV